jgi:hypothetical protein
MRSEKCGRFWNAAVETLKEMGATSVREGEPYGLRGYPDYHRKLFPGSFRKDAWEEPLTAGLGLGLNQRGYPTATERDYPMGGRNDLVVDLGGSETLWLECKTAFRQCLGRPRPGSCYAYNYDGDNCYDPGQGRDSWVVGVSDIALKDVPKLLSLTPTEATYIGVLLLGFDRESAPLTNRELYDLLPRCLDEWEPAHGLKERLSWPDSYPARARLGFRERAWFWYRPVAEPNPTPAIAHDLQVVPATEPNEMHRQALAAVKRFCGVPYRQHGRRQTSGPFQGWYEHDWGHLVQQVAKIYKGRELSILYARNAGDRVRGRFATASNWDAAVNRPGVHEEILAIILAAIN